MLAAPEQVHAFDKLMECKNNTLRFGKLFFPNRFSREFDEGHYKIQAVLDGNHRFRLILAPRGTGKTSIVKTYLTKRIAYQEKQNIVYVSHSQSHSIKQTEDIKEALTDRKITDVFGEMKPHGRDARWSMKGYETNSGIFVTPLGAGQQVRGLLHGDYRPDEIIVDDLEDDTAVKNEVRREELKEWFLSALLGVIDQANENAQFTVIGTLLHPGALLAYLLEDPMWQSIKLELCDDDFNTNYPNYLDTEKVRELAELFRSQGKLDKFYLEFRNSYLPSDATYNKDCFQDFDGTVPPTAETVILVDPAKSRGKKSAETGIVVASIDTIDQKIYVHRAFGEKLSPQEIYSKILDLADQYQPKAIGIESTGLSEFIMHPFKDEMLKRKRFWNVQDIPARGDKEDRARYLSYYYHSKHVYHEKGQCLKLEAQLLSYPRCERWDVIDALAHLIELKDIGSRLWQSEETNLQKELDMIDAEMKTEEDTGIEELGDSWRIV